MPLVDVSQFNVNVLVLFQSIFVDLRLWSTAPAQTSTQEYPSSDIKLHQSFHYLFLY